MREGIPAIVEDTIKYLEIPQRLKLEGIFRVSGSLIDVKSIKDTYEKGGNVNFNTVSDPHTVAGVLKIFFRESLDPLLTFDLYDCWIQVMADRNNMNNPTNLSRDIKRVILRLPPTNRLILYRLMGLLHNVSLHASVNLMNVNNIAIVFAPTLLRPPGDRIELAIQHSSYSNNLIKFMVENYVLIFNDDPKVEPSSPTAPAPTTCTTGTNNNNNNNNNNLTSSGNPNVRTSAGSVSVKNVRRREKKKMKIIIKVMSWKVK